MRGSTKQVPHDLVMTGGARQHVTPGMEIISPAHGKEIQGVVCLIPKDFEIGTETPGDWFRSSCWEAIRENLSWYRAQHSEVQSLEAAGIG